MLLGEKIKAERTAAKMTQEELAAKLGVTPRALINYEQGKRTPSTELLGKLSRIFEKSTDFFFSAEDIFVEDAEARYGLRGKNKAKQLISETSGLFAGGELDDEDKEAFFKAITEIYFESKDRSKKYTPKKYR